MLLTLLGRGRQAAATKSAPPSEPPTPWTHLPSGLSSSLSSGLSRVYRGIRRVVHSDISTDLGDSARMPHEALDAASEMCSPFQQIAPFVRVGNTPEGTFPV